MLQIALWILFTAMFLGGCSILFSNWVAKPKTQSINNQRYVAIAVSDDGKIIDMIPEGSKTKFNKYY
jgi:hypothetical protein